MPTDYDQIADRYQQAKRQPWRIEVEAFSFLGWIGGVAGLDVVDLACGSGVYARHVAERGARRVVGVDLSHAMIDAARGEEQRSPLGIDYLVADGRALPFAGEFDLAVAAYLLNYARSRTDLAAMARSIAASLRPGGRFVTINADPEPDLRWSDAYRPYGFELRSDGSTAEGSPYRWAFLLDGGALEVENYRLPKSAYESALREAGFIDIAWHRPRVAPDALASDPPGYWNALVEHAPVVGLTCRLA